MLWTVVSFIGFTIAVAIISYIKTKGDDQTTAEGYFLAGRGLPGIVIAGSLLLTNISAEQLVGTNGQTWASNMSPISFEVGAAIACLILAFFAAPRYLKSGISTIPEMLGLRYDRTTKLWFSIAYPEPWVQKDVQAVDLTPWKYRWVMAAIVLVGVLVVYAIFSPLGIVR